MKKPAKIALGVLGGLVGVLALAAGYGRFVMKPAQRPAPQMTSKDDAETVERGRYLAENVAVCVDCHTPHDWDRPGYPIRAGMKFAGGERFGPDMGLPGTIWSSNLTSDKETGLGAWTDGEIARAIREGVGRDGHALFPEMPYPHYKVMSDEDVLAIIAFLRRLPPVKNAVARTSIDFPVSIFIKKAPKPLAGPVAPPAPEDRGEYLLSIAGCKMCHTPQERGRPVAALELAGGFEMPGPWGKVWTSNLTPDPATGLGNARASEIERAIRAGTRMDGKPMRGPMPWRWYAQMRPEDMGAMIAALKKRAPIKNDVVGH